MTDPAGARLDDTDQEILDRLAVVAGRLDPQPADLDERIRFALALDELDVEVARLADDLLLGSGARAAERTRTITFEAASLSVMITLVGRSGGRMRLDGWLAPPAAVPVELRLRSASDARARTEIRTRATTADESGRFVFDEVPQGLAQLRVRSPGPGAGIVTPSLLL